MKTANPIPALIEYLKDTERAERLAKSCDTSVAYLKQIAYGHRKAGTRLTLQIEEHSSIGRKTLRPDVYAPRAA